MITSPKPSTTPKKKTKKRDITQVLGPVDSLEYYVKADWWKEIFNANYLRTDGDVVDDPTITQDEIDQFLNVIHPENEAFILDLCCGQGRHSMELARRGFTNVFGLDRSHYLINRAKKQSKAEGLNVNFKEGDARKLPYRTDTFDYVIIPGNSFGYFESLDDDYKVLKEVMRILKPQGKLLLDLTDGDYIRKNYEARSWEWIDKNYFVCRERSLSSDSERLVSREVITHTKKGVIADQFYAERLYTPQSITQLLKNSGFASPEVHNEVLTATQSQRNQDLGMMARRILVTGVADKKWAPKRSKTKTQRSVMVMMGDPRIQDKVKPDGTFDEDDFHTINALKEALGESKDFQFSYFDNHKQMLQQLATRKEKEKIDFVFNLCDEGFNNEATKELHVPALLEMLEIPYSGGNPQCLAYCYDKSLVRGVARELDLPVPEAFVIKPEDTTFIDFPIQFPVIVKPNQGDSSMGITQNSVCHNILELESALMYVREKMGYETSILVEEYLTGKDISVGIIGNLPDNYTVLPIIEEDYSALPEGLPKICGYEAKWDPQSPYWKIKSIPAELPEETSRFLVASCLKLFGRLGCRDYARFDWRLDSNGTPRLLEANPNPGWCWDGHLAKMAKLADISYAEMLHRIVRAAELRIFGE
ncbi:D-alanine-D-alanine ligase [Catalinimonas alkaloidigena]|uniref:D-alanine-D-alanine ligase n=1 Tax=Catalinimonas alkaloidigena TaxID=1075417 RepID=A0A1G9LR71_9BACT|nr:methyltransferase domain-containing protein [Catalinimonas alkaloidigena]SDL64241.1 D-alanine-D-alanine ligase [Catalinimonas alkaloidigena]